MKKMTILLGLFLLFFSACSHSSTKERQKVDWDNLPVLPSVEVSETGDLICPYCHSSEILPIFYGLGGGMGKGEVPGGCLVHPNNPTWLCNTCGRKFGQLAEEGCFKFKCPRCGGEKVIEIIYGKLDNPEAKEGVDFVRGESPVRKDSPTWYCKECGVRGGHAGYIWHERFLEGANTFVVE